MYEIFEKLCAEKGVSAYRVAQDTGVTTATLTSWKQGKYAPKTDKLQKLADYFDVDLDYLMGKSNIRKKIPVLKQIGIDFGNTYFPGKIITTEDQERKERLWQYFSRLNPDMQNNLMEMIESIAKNTQRKP